MAHSIAADPTMDRSGPAQLPLLKAVQPQGPIQNLTQLLARAATATASLTFYTPGNEDLKPYHISYADLQEDAAQKARLLTGIDGLSTSSILLLHFDSQQESIVWFWAATLAGFLPAISTPFVHDMGQRKKHLHHLQTLLQSPVVMTAEKLIPEFLDVEELRLYPVESLSSKTRSFHDSATILPMSGEVKIAEETAVLMLTSGSTGTAKAIPLRHGQLLTALQGKKLHHGTQQGDVFLNWVGLDHVASLCEIHLHAMSLGSEQVHVPASELLQDPLRFIRLLDAHKVAYTFGPNFFLTRLRDALAAHPDLTADLSHLKRINSGGEANVVAMCEDLTRELRRLGARGEVVSPGFGMTETCAGATHALASPSHDLARGLEFASLGTGIPGAKIRVMRQLEDKGEPAACGEIGELQLSGPVIFNGYFNNPAATAESFTNDGWFATGDLAWLDDSWNLNLAGRIKNTINVNGVKWSATEIETSIEEEGIAGLVPSFTVAFATRKLGSPTEDIAVVYSPAYKSDDAMARFETAAAITKTVGLLTGRKPGHLIPLPAEMLEKSSLGKISRTKVRTTFEEGGYAAFEKQDADAVQLYRQSKWRLAETETEKKVQSTLAGLVQVPADEISMDASIFDLGITSFNLILLKAQIEQIVGVAGEIPMSVLMTEPTVGAIASSVDQLQSQLPEYNPIVPLQPHGLKTPLFLIHPGSGDILVFIALAACFPTRPVYAIRTRGYNPNDSLFPTMQDTVDTYVQQIHKTQPVGPYAVAGYSLGSTLAFEVGKKLEAQGQEVRFLASIDYPPHISQYVSGQNWHDVLLHISFFLELIDDDIMARASNYLHQNENTITREEALDYVLSISDAERVDALALTPGRLERISDIGENFRLHGEAYTPVGSVDHLDVFVADPPGYAAKDRKDWRENKLGKWVDFVRSDAEFYECPGIHARMLNPEFVPGFVKGFKAAMKRRGV